MRSHPTPDGLNGAPLRPAKSLDLLADEPPPTAEDYRQSRVQRHAREREQRRLRARKRTVVGLVVIATLLSLATVAAVALPQLELLPSLAAEQSVCPPSEPSTSATDRRADGLGETPLFATYEDIEIRLPVLPEDLTEIGFHQASYRWALPLSTPLADARSSEVRANHGTGRTADQPRGKSAVLDGTVIRMWREGEWGEPDTSADVGAPVGATVVSPVDGVVVKVKEYKLYGKWDDYEIHIQPTGRPNLDVVLLHIYDVCVKEGDKVLGGITPLAKIRRLDDKEPMQLRNYTAEGDQGNHVHVQVNDATYPGYKGLEGALLVR